MAQVRTPDKSANRRRLGGKKVNTTIRMPSNIPRAGKSLLERNVSLVFKKLERPNPIPMVKTYRLKSKGRPSCPRAMW